MEFLLPLLITGIFFGLRIYGAIYCSKKADELNRNTGFWAVFGLFLPIIAMLIISNLKKNINWHKD